MRVTARVPTKTDRKFGRASCAKCGAPAVRIWGCKPAPYPLCSVHNNEYVDAVLNLINQEEKPDGQAS